MTTTHDLKCWPKPFQATWDGFKLFEIRDNDRNYKVGDTVILKEFIPETQKYTGREIQGRITYITDFSQLEGFVVFGFKTINFFMKYNSPSKEDTVDPHQA